ncbi:MAG: hypothetical protein JNM25_16250 [Planctomycetes bacterium]|nr:hypothetical protein [Planctomycetota bacterium]
MMSVRSLLSPLLFLFACLVAAPSPAQDLRFVHPEKYERATKTDAAGMLQWDTHKEEKCPTCAGTGKMKCMTCARFFDDATVCIECKRNKEREAVCRACGGLGHFADPLEKALCPCCQGAGFIECGLCSGGGRLKGEGSDRWSTCSACRGDGGWKCAVCDGERLVEVASLKPSLAEASVATLTKAMATTDQALAALGKFTPAGGPDARKAVKELVKDLQIAQSIYPPLKRTPKFFEMCMSKTYGGSQYQGQAEREGQVQGTVKNSAEFYLKHQKHMMELALKRLEANEKLAAENKGK